MKALREKHISTDGISGISFFLFPLGTDIELLKENFRGHSFGPGESFSRPGVILMRPRHIFVYQTWGLDI